MKKTYITPKLEIITFHTESPMADSIVNPYGIGYGGLDTNGETPSSRFFSNLWEGIDEE